ncbi:hypothetical protein [Aridibaculum aurantiacum]|uniref:hypothetical protein n=1 Tax=Aridibaculum aurantiacum TaxID=2810307 RepID=UPI001A97CEA0|nr:hypothetical protein [Aridibaculum aurantiacum]
MQSLDEQVKRIEAKVQQLLKEYRQSQREVQRLQEDKLALQHQLQVQVQKSNELAQTISVMKIHSLTENDTSKKELEKRINSYLKEIDKCLALLQA